MALKLLSLFAGREVGWLDADRRSAALGLLGR